MKSSLESNPFHYDNRHYPIVVIITNPVFMANLLIKQTAPLKLSSLLSYTLFQNGEYFIILLHYYLS